MCLFIFTDFLWCNENQAQNTFVEMMCVCMWASCSQMLIVSLKPLPWNLALALFLAGWITEAC